ncbi:pectin acetylesterase [Aureococcus anophagefferens]|nr:pectin acetylesterase [Aureococcus anophagefferens]
MVLRKAALVAALAATAGAWSCNDAGAETLMTLTSLQATDAGAVCNDGTPAAYYFAPGSPSSKTFLVYLSGGGQCYDAASCAGRGDGSLYPHHNCSTSDASKPCFLSSKDYGATCNKTGIFSEDPAANRPLHGAHKAYVPYCSSDAHMGDGEKFGLQFRGRRIVDAVLADLAAHKGLGDADLVVFGGGSAGGRGAMVHLDRAAATLKAAGAGAVVGFLDSPYYVDVAPYPPAHFVGFLTEMEDAYENFDTSGVFDGWQISNSILGYNGIVADPVLDADETSYADALADTTRGLVAALPAKKVSDPKSSVFSIACYSHHASEKAKFADERALDSNASQADALFMFLQPSVTTSLKYVDGGAGGFATC